MKQFGRVLQLKIGNTSESLVYNNLRIIFDVKKTITQEPNTAEISIYNLNRTNRNLITSKQYGLVELSVCYQEDTLRLIFKGNVISVENTSSGNDIITKLKCGDGYNAYTEKTIVKTMAAGQTDSDFLNEAASSFGIQKGGVSLPNDRALPRAKVFMCDTREAMSRIALNNNADWSIQDDQLVVVPKDKVISDNEGFVLSRESGMIGSPQKTDKGLELTTLCNPHFKIGSLVRVESIITEYNGDYKIQSIQHSGDLLGNDWKSKLICTGGKFEVMK